MAENKIIIGNRIGNSKDDEMTRLETMIRERAALRQIQKTATDTVDVTAPGATEAKEDETLEGDVWGNDRKLRTMLDENQLADRRLFARVKYMQRIQCISVMDYDESYVMLASPVELMVVDISMGGISIISDYELEAGMILVFEMKLDNASYVVKYEVVYCFANDGKYRAGLKIKEKDKRFLNHLKILVARITLQSQYGNKAEAVCEF